MRLESRYGRARGAPKLMRPRKRLIDVQAVITDALKAAGLMKS